MFISILGRQRELSLAELEAVFGSDKLRPLSSHSALVDSPTPDINTLGGSIKIIGDVHELKTSSLNESLRGVTEFLRAHVQKNDSGKVSIGLSVYDDSSADTRTLQSFLIKSKKSLRADGFSVRVVPNKKADLSSAQVLHNKLASGRNIEIVLIKTDSGYWLGKTDGVQNIEALARRDQGRPKRDTRVGMLPPKLALMILNLAGAQSQTETPRTVLDPFCGTGVVLQEALLLGLDTYGADIDERMIEYSEINLDWIKSKLNLSGSTRIEQGDATKYTWKEPISLVACETYLGPPMSSIPTPRELEKIVSDVDYLHKSFLENIRSQLTVGTKLCVAVPAWRIGGKIRHLPMVDDLEDLGYTRQVLKYATNDDLIYFRPDQTVARELLVLERK